MAVSTATGNSMVTVVPEPWTLLIERLAAVKLDDGLREGKAQAHALIARVVGGPLPVKRTDDEIELFGRECRYRYR